MKTIQRQCTCLLWTLLLVFFSVQTALASACAGDVNVMSISTVPTSLTDSFGNLINTAHLAE